MTIFKMYYQRLETQTLTKFKKLLIYRNRLMIEIPEAFIDQTKAQLFH